MDRVETREGDSSLIKKAGAVVSTIVAFPLGLAGSITSPFASLAEGVPYDPLRDGMNAFTGFAFGEDSRAQRVCDGSYRIGRAVGYVGIGASLLYFADAMSEGTVNVMFE